MLEKPSQCTAVNGKEVFMILLQEQQTIVGADLNAESSVHSYTSFFSGPTISVNYVVIQVLTASMVKWSEFLATHPEARVRFLALPEKK
jgi:hypothetical protein